MTTYKKISDLDVSTTIANTDLFIMETLTGTKSVTVETFRNSSQVTKEQIGLGNVDNTSDLAKPVSTATQTALDAKLNSTTAASTYLSQADAAATYLTQNNASGTYLSKVDAVNTYLQKVDATTTYATKTELNTGLGTKQDELVSGTNIKTINNNSIVGSGNITIDSLPSQAEQSGKFLTTDGSAASWATVDLSSKQDVLVSGTNIKTVNNNSILGSGNLEIDALPAQQSHAGQFLTTNGSTASWAAVDMSSKQDVSNLVTTITASSTDAQYPSAKCVYDLIGNLETVLSQI